MVGPSEPVKQRRFAPRGNSAERVARPFVAGVDLELDREVPAPGIVPIDSRPLRRRYPDHGKGQLTCAGLFLRPQRPASQHRIGVLILSAGWTRMRLSGVVTEQF